MAVSTKAEYMDRIRVNNFTQDISPDKRVHMAQERCTRKLRTTFHSIAAKNWLEHMATMRMDQQVPYIHMTIPHNNKAKTNSYTSDMNDSYRPDVKQGKSTQRMNEWAYTACKDPGNTQIKTSVWGGML